MAKRVAKKHAAKNIVKGIKEDKVICMIDFSRNALDNDYWFYSSGKIVHRYDRSIYSHSHEETLQPAEISSETKKAIIAKTPAENLKKVKKILGVK